MRSISNVGRAASRSPGHRSIVLIFECALKSLAFPIFLAVVLTGVREHREGKMSKAFYSVSGKRATRNGALRKPARDVFIYRS